jgi:chaperonin GroEL
MQSKDLKFFKDAKGLMMKGVAQLADAVAVTMGPAGRTVVIERPGRSPLMTKDGATVAHHVKLQDPFEGLACEMVKEVAKKTAIEAGDGTTTATVLARHIFELGLEQLNQDPPVNLESMIEGMRDGVKEIVTYLKKHARQADDQGDFVTNVAKISANGDDSIARTIKAAMDAVGKEGLVTIEEGKGLRDELAVVDGMRLEMGYISPYFVTNRSNMTAELTNVVFLVVQGKLTTTHELMGLLEDICKKGLGLIVIAEEIEGEAYNTLILNAAQGIIKMAAVRLPSAGIVADSYVEDICKLTGAQLVGDTTNIGLRDVRLEHLGRAGRVTCCATNMTIIDGATSSEVISEHVQHLTHSEVTADYLSPEEREFLKRRIAQLKGGVAVVRIGASSELEMNEKKARVEDALHATRAALEEGIVPGGGIALFRAKNTVEKLLRSRKTENRDRSYKIGLKIITQVCDKPLETIVENNGEDSSKVKKIVHTMPFSMGYDSRTKTYKNLVKGGVIDPVKVTRLALENACNIASTMLSTNCLIVNTRDEDQSKT